MIKVHSNDMLLIPGRNGCPGSIHCCRSTFYHCELGQRIPKFRTGNAGYSVSRKSGKQYLRLMCRSFQYLFVIAMLITLINHVDQLNY